MWWPIIILILLSFYFIFVSGSDVRVDKPTVFEPKVPPFHYAFETNINQQLQFKTSLGNVWQFHLNDSFYFHKGQIYTRDECFGKKDGSFVVARGESLYKYVQRQQLHPSKGGQVKTHVTSASRYGHLFYFVCKENRIDGLSTCPPGEIFDQNRCVSIDPCTNEPDGTVFADAFDKQFYFSCPEGRLKCPTGTFFMLDACRSESSLQCPSLAFPINLYNIFTCVDGKPRVITCPKDFIVFENKCIPDICYHRSDGSKVAFPKENIGPFWYSPGYYVCKNNKIEKSVECPSEWDKYDSKGDALLFIPQVFHEGKCTVPEFCENVTANDVVVHKYDFTKNVKNWENSLLFDRSVGFKCDNGKVRFQVPPGHWIYDFKVVPACGPEYKRIVLADKIDGFFNCDTNAIESCPPNTFFDGTTCRDYIYDAHRYNDVDIFKFDNLNFNWIEPWNYSKDENVQCQDPEPIYINGYNICAHPDCKLFPFLKQIRTSIQLDETSKCLFQHNKIVKTKTARKKHFNFWMQRKSIQFEPCIPGSKLKSGHFLKDSVLFTTCDSRQPFVFCPSASTSHIQKIDEVYACLPDKSVFESTLKANTLATFLENHLDRIIPSPGSLIMLDGKRYGSNEIHIDGKPVTILSDKDVHLVFKMLVNYPPQTFFENGQLKTFKDPNRIFVTRYNSGSTLRPVDFCTYNIQDSVTGFQSDAT